MFNFFKKHGEEKPDSSQEHSDEQALLIDIPFESMTELGTEEERKAIEELEEGIKKLLPEGSEFDGDGFGEGECNIFIYGESADEMFKSVEDFLRESRFNHIDICLQYGPPEDPSTQEKRFTM